MDAVQRRLTGLLATVRKAPEEEMSCCRTDAYRAHVHTVLPAGYKRWGSAADTAPKEPKIGPEEAISIVFALISEEIAMFQPKFWKKRRYFGGKVMRRRASIA